MIQRRRSSAPEGNKDLAHIHRHARRCRYHARARSIISLPNACRGASGTAASCPPTTTRVCRSRDITATAPQDRLLRDAARRAAVHFRPFGVLGARPWPLTAIYDVENDSTASAPVRLVGLATMVAFIWLFPCTWIKRLTVDFGNTTIEANAWHRTVPRARSTIPTRRRHFAAPASIYIHGAMAVSVVIPTADAQRAAGCTAGRRGETRMIFEKGYPGL